MSGTGKKIESKSVKRGVSEENSNHAEDDPRTYEDTKNDGRDHGHEKIDYEKQNKKARFKFAIQLTVSVFSILAVALWLASVFEIPFRVFYCIWMFVLFTPFIQKARIWWGRYRKTGSPFLAWLMRISHNLVIDFYRSKKDVTYPDNELEFKDSDAGPEQLAEEHFDQQQTRKVILKLPDEQQQVILMSFIEGFTYTEIAASLRKSEGNIRVIVHRALKNMRQMLEVGKYLD